MKRKLLTTYNIAAGCCFILSTLSIDSSLLAASIFAGLGLYLITKTL